MTRTPATRPYQDPHRHIVIGSRVYVVGFPDSRGRVIKRTLSEAKIIHSENEEFLTKWDDLGGSWYRLDELELDDGE